MSDPLLLPPTIDPKSREAIDERIRQQKEDLIEVLKTMPIISVAVIKVGIHKCTFYRWEADDKEFTKKAKEARKEGIELVHDKAFSVFIKNGTNGNNWRAAYELIKYLDRIMQEDEKGKSTGDLSVILSNPDAIIALAEILKLANINSEKKEKTNE